MDIQDVLIFQDLVKPGHLMVHKHMEKKIGPVFGGADGREPHQQFLDGGPRVPTPGLNRRFDYIASKRPRYCLSRTWY